MRALYQWDPSESSLRNSPLGNKNLFFMLLRGETIFQQTRLAALAWSRALRDPKGEHQLWVFGAENTPESEPFKAENNAQKLPKQLQNNFEKVQKSTFLTPKMAKTQASIWPKVSIFGSIFAQRILFLACWY